MIVYDIASHQLEKVKPFGVALAKSENEVVEESEYIIIAVKPQVVENVLLPLKDNLKNKCLISIVLGYDFEKYNELLDPSTRHIFIMPNTPVQVMEGMCLIEEKHSLNENEFEYVKKMFLALGDIEIVPTHLMGVGGALSGSGPAYLYMVIEALADGVVMKGMPRQMAYKLASQLMIGSGKMQKETALNFGILKDNVCSPSGTTIQDVKALEDHKIRAAFIEAICSSTKL